MKIRLMFGGILATLVAFAFQSCRATKKINVAINNKDSVAVAVLPPTVDSAIIKNGFYDRVYSNSIDFETFSSKVKIDFEDNSGKKNSATALVRILKNKVIWISLTGALGIEGYRVMIDADSVLVMNKLEKTVSVRTIKYLQEMVNLPLDFVALQDLIIGNPVFFEKNISSFRPSEENLIILSIGSEFRHSVTLDTASNIIRHSKLDDLDGLRNRTCAIHFDEYVPVQNKWFAEKREIMVAEKSKLDIKLDFKQVEFNTPLTFPFTIPKSYKWLN